MGSIFWGIDHHSQVEEHGLLFGDECVNCRHYCLQVLHIFWVKVKLFNKFPETVDIIVHTFMKLFTFSSKLKCSTQIPGNVHSF